MSTLYVIRHAQASFGQVHYDKLSPLGVRQAQALGKHLLETQTIFDSMHSGTLTRHLETAREYVELAKLGGKALKELNQNSALNEFDLNAVFTTLMPQLIAEDPSFETEVKSAWTDRTVFRRVLLKGLEAWASNRYEMPNVVSWRDFSDRVNTTLLSIMQNAKPGEKVAVFTSGGVILAALEGSQKEASPFAMDSIVDIVNTSVNRFQLVDNKLSLTTFNESTHLGDDDDLKTFI